MREGCGLVLIRPFAGELSPLTPADLKPEDSELEEPRAAGQDGIFAVAPHRAITTSRARFRSRASPSAISRTSSIKPIATPRC